MHDSSMRRMQSFLDDHVSPAQHRRRVLDIGSMDVNGTYRNLFHAAAWEYIGLDTAAGPGVDVVVADAYRWRALRSNSFDLVISGQAFEHIEFPWVTMLEVARALRPGGLCCIIVPSTGPVHQFPLDCWRFYPDGITALAHWADLAVVHAETHWAEEGWGDASDQWHDSVLVARKLSAARPILGTAKRALLRFVTQHQASRRTSIADVVPTVERR